ncbi:MAG: glycosyl transferase, group 1 [Cyanobacteria bacterium RYN_339]|nr:glycosyl transferase, group 1 [Cyanobacteria bacterium RYN_339]
MLDVCLVLEGTYPYVLGGVASWVHQLISGLPDVRFGLVCLVAEDGKPPDRYLVPPNVVFRQDVALFGKLPDDGRRAEPTRGLIDAARGLHAPGALRCPFFRQLARQSQGRSAACLLASKAAWGLVRELYRQRGRSVPIMDYFWTWRAIHTPLLRLLDVELPAAKVYHTTSTGYAGLLAALAKLRLGAGVAVTEHGLFGRERELEIFNADWIYRAPAGRANPEHERFLKGWWRASFNAMCELTYGHADQLITLHDANRRIQVDSGAPADRLAVVPNGIDPEPYVPLRAGRDWSERPFRVGYIGRIVPIKDLKTFLRAIALANREEPVEGLVLGPGEESPDYVASCHELVADLGIADKVTFAGKVDVAAWLPRLDVLAMTSISESQPLVILEAAAAGVPSIATDVGACREMLEGRTPEDAALGESGLVTPPLSPEETARAIVALARDPRRHAAMAAAGIERVERFYRQADVYAFYRQLYLDLAGERYEPLAGHDRRAA